MATPREFKKKVWFPYLFAGSAFLAAILDIIHWIVMGYDFTLYMFFGYFIPILSFLGAGVLLILFAHKKPKDTIFPVSLIFGSQALNLLYLIFKYIDQHLNEYAIFAGLSAIYLSAVLLLYILNVLGRTRERTLLVVLVGIAVGVLLAASINALWPYITYLYPVISLLILNVSMIIFDFLETFLFSLPIWYVYSLKKVEPPVIKIALTMQEKIAMIDKLYLMFQKGEITEAEYIEKKKELLKEI